MRRTFAQTLMESPLLASIYESRLWRRSPLLGALLGISFDAEQQLILDAADLRGDEQVLDLACGTGIYTRPLAHRLPHGYVIGLDLSPPMLRYAADAARAEDLANLAWTRASALAIPFADARFTTVLCSAALHLMPDTGGALAESHRVLRPGGRIVLAVFRMQSGWLARATARARRGVGTRAFSTESLEQALTAAGFIAMESLHARGGWLIVRAKKSI